jgi:hypothetical protein
MMHRYGYNTKRVGLRLFWETLILPINLTLCNIENGFVASTQRISRIWKDHKVRQKTKLKQQADTWLKEKYGMLTFDDYQETARKTAVYPSNYKLTYPALGLVGEAGEVIRLKRLFEMEKQRCHLTGRIKWHLRLETCYGIALHWPVTLTFL